VAGGWRKLYNEEFHNFYLLPNIIRMIKSRGMRMGMARSMYGEIKNVCKILVGKPEEKRLLRRLRHR
jgi:hypothetical protein